MRDVFMYSGMMGEGRSRLVFLDCVGSSTAAIPCSRKRCSARTESEGNVKVEAGDTCRMGHSKTAIVRASDVSCSRER